MYIKRVLKRYIYFTSLKYFLQKLKFNLKKIIKLLTNYYNSVTPPPKEKKKIPLMKYNAWP